MEGNARVIEATILTHLAPSGPIWPNLNGWPLCARAVHTSCATRAASASSRPAFRAASVSSRPASRAARSTSSRSRACREVVVT